MSEQTPLIQTPAPQGQSCPQCAQPLLIKHIGQDSFWACAGYPACRYTRSLHEEASFSPERLDGAICPECAGQLWLKKGRYGFFIGCGNFPDCAYIADPEPDAPQPLAVCPECRKGHLVERTNKFGKVFYACDNYPKCKFALNHKPVEQACPQCSYPLLVERSSTQGPRLGCPQKSCSYRSKPL